MADSIKKYSITDKVDAAERIVKLFHVERMMFFTVSSITAIAIIGLSIYQLYTCKITVNQFFAYMAPTGGIAISCGLILSMYSKTMAFLEREIK